MILACSLLGLRTVRIHCEDFNPTPWPFDSWRRQFFEQEIRRDTTNVVCPDTDGLKLNPTKHYVLNSCVITVNHFKKSYINCS